MGAGFQMGRGRWCQQNIGIGQPVFEVTVAEKYN